MGMSTYVKGIKPSDSTYQKMLAVFNACHDAGVNCPKVVLDFFNGNEPDGLGIIVDLPVEVVRHRIEPSKESFEVDLKKLPKDVTVIRFTNHW